MKPKGKLNPRQEAFCRAYAGKAWGNAAEAYRLAGYRAKSPQSAGNAAFALLENLVIRERVKELRGDVEERLNLDRLELAEMRAEIARNPNADTGQRLAAMRDLEKMLGYLEPDKLDVRHSGQIEHRWTVENLKEANAASGE
jgi:phage terminase small subunit